MTKTTKIQGLIVGGKPYSSSASYRKGNVVTYNNKAYIALQGTPDTPFTAQAPPTDADSNDYWQLFLSSVNGITPLLRINSTTKMWEMSVDGGTTYTSMNVKAEGVDGTDGITPQIRINSTTFNWETSVDGGTTWTDTGIASKQAVSGATVVQETGTSTENVMSQKAVTDIIKKPEVTVRLSSEYTINGILKPDGVTIVPPSSDYWCTTDYLATTDMVSVSGNILATDDWASCFIYDKEKALIKYFTGSTVSFNLSDYPTAAYLRACADLNHPDRYYLDIVQNKGIYDFSQIEKISTIETNINKLMKSLNKSLNNRYSLLRYVKTDANFIAINAYFFGRWFMYNNCVTTINAGSEIYFKVKGATSITANISCSVTSNYPYISISVDGGDYTRMVITNGDNTIASGLTTDEHIIRIVVSAVWENASKWNGYVGLSISSITVDAGTIIAIKPECKCGIYYGDSITEGVNLLGNGATSSVACAEKEWVYICSNLLNINNIRVGFGATGVTVSGSGGVPKATTVVDNMANGIEEAAQEPDFIVLNYGQNDATGDAFITAYTELINRLRIKYSGRPIFAVVPFSQSHKDEIKTLCVNYTDVVFVDTYGWITTTTDGVHLDEAGAKDVGIKMASVLYDFFGVNYFTLY